MLAWLLRPSVADSFATMASNFKCEFSLGLKPTDLTKNSLLIVGNIKHLKLLQYDDVKVKLQPVVTKEVCRPVIFTVGGFE